MKSFIVFVAVLACVSAKPQVLTYNAGFPYSAFGTAAYPYTAAYPFATQYSAAAPAIQYTAAAPAIQYTAAAPAIQYTAAAPAIQYTAAAPAIQYAAAAPAIIAPAFTKTQYHAQSELGEASFGYAHPGQAASEVRDALGNVRGSYAYIDPNGKEVRANYVADAGGFRVESNALPEAPVHVIPPADAAPAPVADTPEVAAARAEHLKAVDEAIARNAAQNEADAAEIRAGRTKRGIISAPAVTYAAAPALTYAAAPLATYATSYSYRYDAPKVKTLIAPAPLKTIAYAAPAPLKTVTYAAAPAWKTIAYAAPAVKTVAYAAPAVKTIAYAAPAVKTIAYAAPAPLKTIAYAAPAWKTYAGPLATYGYSSAFAPSLYSNYGYGYGYSPLAYSAGYSKILY